MLFAYELLNESVMANIFAYHFTFFIVIYMLARFGNVPANSGR